MNFLIESQQITAKCPVCGKENPPTKVELMQNTGGSDIAIRATYRCLIMPDQQQEECETEYNVKITGRTARRYLETKLPPKEEPANDEKDQN